MEQPLDKIRRLSKLLPQKDSELAVKFIENREFDKLFEIVESDIYMVKQNELLEHPKEKFANINIEDLLELKEVLKEYMVNFEISDWEEDDDWFDEQLSL